MPGRSIGDSPFAWLPDAGRPRIEEDPSWKARPLRPFGRRRLALVPRPPPVHHLPPVFAERADPGRRVHGRPSADQRHGAQRPAAFQEQRRPHPFAGRALPLVEWTFIFLPILFHAVVGWLIISGALPNASRYRLRQQHPLHAAAGHRHHRLCVHPVSRDSTAPPGSATCSRRSAGPQFDPEHATSTRRRGDSPAVDHDRSTSSACSSTVYHFANGLWTQGITWGVWTTAAAQRRAKLGLRRGGDPAGRCRPGSAFGGLDRVDIERAERSRKRNDRTTRSHPRDRAARQPTHRRRPNDATARLPSRPAPRQSRTAVAQADYQRVVSWQSNA